MATGSGTGTPVSGGGAGTVQAIPPVPWQNTAVPLHLYAQTLRLDECALWGVYYDGQQQYDCGTIWTPMKRWQLAHALAQAQLLMEQELGYPMVPTWIRGDTIDPDPRWYDVQAVPKNLSFGITRWGMLQVFGVKAETDLGEQEIDYDTEPATIAIATDNPASEYQFFYPDTDVRIYPSHVTTAANVHTFHFPKCRLVTNYSNDETGWDFTESSNFLPGIDARRVYNDPSTNIEFVAAHRSSTGAYDPDGVRTVTAAAVVNNMSLGLFSGRIANYADGSWTTAGANCPGAPYDQMRLYYKAGLPALSTDFVINLIRLAHSLLPEEPCGCRTVTYLWSQDSKIPQVVTADRANCPFGISDGAWQAYQFVRQRALRKAAVI